MIDGIKPYPVMRDSGVEWLGQIPEHWEVRPLKYAVSFAGGGTPSKADASFWSGHIPWVSPKDMTRAQLHDTADHITNDAVAASATSIVPPGAVLIVVRSGILRRRIPVATNTVPMALNQDMKALRPKDGIAKSEYLRVVIQGNESSLLRAWTKQGATVESIEHGFLANSRMPLPPLPEQTAIVHFLDYADRRIQHYIRAKEKSIALLEEYRQAIIHQAVTGQVDVRTSQPYPAYKDSGLKWLKQVPEHWDVVRNGQLFVQRNEVGFSELPILEISLRTGIRVRDLEDPDRKQVMSNRSKYKRAVKGDIAYNMMRMWQGAVGVTPVDGLVSPAYVVAKPLVGTNPQYFNALFRTSAYMTEIDKYSRGIVKDRNRLYWEDFKRMATPCPPQEEQVLIADFNDRNVVTIDQEVCQLERQIHLLKEYRTRLIADIVTGKLDVRAAAAALPEVDPLARGDVDDPLDPDVDSALENLESRTEVII